MGAPPSGPSGEWGVVGQLVCEKSWFRVRWKCLLNKSYGKRGVRLFAGTEYACLDALDQCGIRLTGTEDSRPDGESASKNSRVSAPHRAEQQTAQRAAFQPLPALTRPNLRMPSLLSAVE